MFKPGPVRRASWLVAACLLLSSACGGDDKTAEAPGASSVDSAALGTPNKATGTPVTIGYLSVTGSGTLDAQGALNEQGAKIAVSYVNDYLGGIAGHPVELFICGDKSTPAGAQQCANQFVEKKVAAVVWPYTGQGSVVPTITAAGIPVVIGSGASTEELRTDGVFAVTGGYPAVLGAFAADAKEQGVKKFAMIVTDAPAATQGATALGGIVFKSAGVDYDVVPAAPGTADLSPQLSQAIAEGADALGVTGDVTFCTSFLQAYENLGLDAKKYVISTCNDTSVVKAMPNALEGARSANPTAAGPDDEVYAAMVGTYGDNSIDPDPLKSTGVAAGADIIMNLARGLEGFTGEATPAAIKAQFKQASGEIFGSGGLTFKCDGTAIPILPTICSAELQLAELNADGSAKSTKAVDAAPLFKTG